MGQSVAAVMPGLLFYSDNADLLAVFIREVLMLPVPVNTSSSYCPLMASDNIR